MQGPRVDGHLGFLVSVDGGAGPEAPDHPRVGCLDGQLLADVRSELTDVVGERRAGVDVEVGHDLGTEPLTENDVAMEPSIGRRVRGERRVL